MTHQPAPISSASADAGRQLVRLGEVLELVESLAGCRPAPARYQALDQDCRISAYRSALPVEQRRFDTLAAETAAWAAAGVEALLTGNPSRAAAAVLADELGRALGDLDRTLRL